MNEEMSSNIHWINSIIHQFYEKPTTANQEAYEQLLVSDGAWAGCAAMLDPETMNSDVQFFAASVIFSRIARLAHKIGLEERQELRASLIMYICRYAKSEDSDNRQADHSLSSDATSKRPPKSVYTRLCVSLVRLAIRMKEDGQWQGPLCDLSSVCQATMQGSLAAEVIGQVLIKLFGLFSEELKTTQDGFPSEDVSLARHELILTAPFVFKYIEDHMMCTRVELDCISSWCRLGVNVEVFSSRLMNFMFNAVEQKEHRDLSEAACDCLGEVIFNRNANNVSNHFWINEFIPRILRIGNIIYKYSELPCPVEDDLMDHLCRIVKIIAAFMENRTSAIFCFQCPPVVRMQIMMMLLACTSFPGVYPVQERISDLALSSWYSIVDEFSVDATLNDNEDEDENEDRHISAFMCRPSLTNCVAMELNPLYCKCIQVLAVKNCLPANPDAFSHEDNESFRIYRVNISDTMSYIYSVLKDQCYSILIEYLLAGISQKNWIIQESALSLIGSLLEQDETSDHTIEYLIELIPNYNFDVDRRFLVTGVSFIGQMSESLRYFPQSLPFIIQFLAQHLTSDKDITLHVTAALRNVARETREFLYPYAEILVQECGRVIGGNYDECDRERCMGVIGYALSFVTPPDILQQGFEYVVAPYIRNILDSLTVIENNPTMGPVRRKEIEDSLMTDMRLITNFVISFTTPTEDDDSAELCRRLVNSSLLLLDGIMPILSMIIASKQCSMSIFEGCMEIVSRFLSFLEQRFLPHLHTSAQFFISRPDIMIEKNALNFVRQCCILFYPVKSRRLVNDAGGMAEANNMKIVETMFTEALKRSQYSISNASSNSNFDMDYIVEFALFVQQLGKRVPALFETISEDLYRLVLDVMVEGLRRNEHMTVKTCSSTMVVLVKQARSMKILAECGEQLCTMLICSVVLDASPICTESLVRMLAALANPNLHLPFASWLRRAMQSDRLKTKVTDQEKERFVLIVSREPKNIEKCQKAARQLADLARGTWQRTCQEDD